MPAAEFDPGPILRALDRHGVDFVVIGGQAAVLLGSVRATYDVDIAYARDRRNLERLADALRELGAKPRGAPGDVPFLLEAETLARGLNFTFTTRFGPLDILGEPAGAPPYAELKRAAAPTELAGSTIRSASIDHLIAMKEASGRPHDVVAAQELRVISDELRAPGPGGR